MDLQLSQLISYNWFNRNPSYTHIERFIDWSQLFAGDPIPPIRDIHATGYDAIAQFRMPLIGKLFDRNFGYPHNRLSQVYNANQFSANFQQIANSNIANLEVYAPVYRFGSNSTVRVAFEASAIEIELGQSTFNVFEENNNYYADISFNYHIKIKAIETDASVNSRYGIISIPHLPSGGRSGRITNPEKVTTAFTIANGAFTLQKCRITNRDELISLSTELLLDFASRQRIIIQSNNNVATADFLPRMQTLLNDKFTSLGTYPITRLFLNRNAQRDFNLDNFNIFRSHLKIVGTENNKVLSVCFEANVAERLPDLNAVMSFVGNKSYGFFTSEHLIKMNIRNTWGSLNFNKVLIADVPYKHGDMHCIATIRYELARLNDILFQYGSEKYPDFISIGIILKSKVLRLMRLNLGLDITSSAGDLLNEKSYTNYLFLFPFNGPEQVSENSEPAIDVFLRNIVLKLITRNLIVTPSISDLINMEGKTSTPLKCMLVLADSDL